MSMITCNQCKREYPDAFQLIPLCPYCHNVWYSAILNFSCVCCVCAVLLLIVILLLTAAKVTPNRSEVDSALYLRIHQMSPTLTADYGLRTTNPWQFLPEPLWPQPRLGVFST
jgi:hypothetical protein